MFADLKIDFDKPVVAACNTATSASTLALIAKMMGNPDIPVYPVSYKQILKLVYFLKRVVGSSIFIIKCIFFYCTNHLWHWVGGNVKKKIQDGGLPTPPYVISDKL